MPARAPSGHLQRISVSVNQCHLLLQNPPGHPAVHARAVRRLQSSDVHTNHQARVPEYYPSPIPPGPAAIPPSLRPSSNTIDTCTFVHTHKQVYTHARTHACNIISICTTAVRSTVTVGARGATRPRPHLDASTPRRNVEHCTIRASSEASTAERRQHHTPPQKKRKKKEKRRKKENVHIISYIIYMQRVRRSPRGER